MNITTSATLRLRELLAIEGITAPEFYEWFKGEPLYHGSPIEGRACESEARAFKWLRAELRACDTNGNPTDWYSPGRFQSATCEGDYCHANGNGTWHVIASPPLTEKPSWWRPAGQSILDHEQREADGGPKHCGQQT